MPTSWIAFEPMPPPSHISSQTQSLLPVLPSRSPIRHHHNSRYLPICTCPPTGMWTHIPLTTHRSTHSHNSNGPDYHSRVSMLEDSGPKKSRHSSYKQRTDSAPHLGNGHSQSTSEIGTTPHYIMKTVIPSTNLTAKYTDTLQSSTPIVAPFKPTSLLPHAPSVPGYPVNIISIKDNLLTIAQYTPCNAHVVSIAPGTTRQPQFGTLYQTRKLARPPMLYYHP